MTTLPYDFIEPGTPENGIPNEPSVEGELLGAELARLASPCIEQFLREFPNEPPPCHECAFVKGALGNRCVQSTMAALKCVVEDIPFFCHKGLDGQGDPKRLCTGWLASMVSIKVSEEIGS